MKSGAPFTPKTSCRSIALLPLPQMDCVSRYVTGSGEVRPTIGFGGLSVRASRQAVAHYLVQAEKGQNLDVLHFRKACISPHKR